MYRDGDFSRSLSKERARAPARAGGGCGVSRCRRRFRCRSSAARHAILVARVVSHPGPRPVAIKNQLVLTALHHSSQHIHSKERTNQGTDEPRDGCVVHTTTTATGTTTEPGLSQGPIGTFPKINDRVLVAPHAPASKQIAFKGWVFITAPLLAVKTHTVPPPHPYPTPSSPIPPSGAAKAATSSRFPSARRGRQVAREVVAGVVPLQTKLTSYGFDAWPRVPRCPVAGRLT